MIRWASFAPIALIAATGCLASKSDIQLLQDELRASRAQTAAGDTSILRADDARRAQIAQLSASIARMNDSLRVLSIRISSFQANVNGEMAGMAQQLVQFQALLGQTTRNIQDARSKIEALSEAANAGAASPGVASPVVAGDTAHRAPSGIPGPATLFTTAVEQLGGGSYRTARDGFDLLLSSYPDFNQASLAQLHVGEAYAGMGNSAAADSVYQLVATKYPKSQEASIGLYRHGKALWESNNKVEGRRVLSRVIQDYPGSDAAKLAANLLNAR